MMLNNEGCMALQTLNTSNTDFDMATTAVILLPSSSVSNSEQLVFDFGSELSEVVVEAESSPSNTGNLQQPAQQSTEHSQHVANVAATTGTNKIQLNEGYDTYTFIKIDPTTNCRRSYQLAYQPGLFAQHTVQKRWGRLGSQKMRVLHQEYDGEAEAIGKP
jgi:hypothetical protein